MKTPSLGPGRERRAPARGADIIVTGLLIYKYRAGPSRNRPVGASKFVTHVSTLCYADAFSAEFWHPQRFYVTLADKSRLPGANMTAPPPL